ncbi:MAG: hypothetical protein J7K15_10190 [Deltaproteobacteria bacterium]|nr:hypothetical protein [Deltaproteobacteria bacterium]
MARVTGTLVVEVLDACDRVRDRRVQEINLTLDNFIRLFQVVLLSVAQGSTKSVSGLTEESGQSAIVVTGNSVDCWDYAYWGDFKTRVCIGTGTTAPSNSDYKLEAEIGCADASIEDVTFGDTEMSFVVTGVIPVDTNVDVSEVGAKLMCSAQVFDPTLGDFVPSSAAFLIFRDVLSTPVSAKAGDKVRVVYKITITR